MLLALAIAASPASATRIHRESKLLDFSFEWPPEAAAIPSLNSRFRSEMTKAYAEALKDAREDMALTRKQKRDYNQHYYDAAWDVLGRSQRILSLEGVFESFTGGAHPNHDYKAIVWDRKADKQVSIGVLFARPANFESLTRLHIAKRSTRSG